MANVIGVSSVYNAVVVIAIIANKSIANQLMSHERKLHQVNAVICDGDFECPPDCPTDPCLCTEDGMSETCKDGTCHESGCDQCINGYFKKDYNSLCVQCQETTGDSCIHCTDFLGCQQCKPGVPLVYAINCGIYVCADICGTTTEEESAPTHMPSNEPTKNPTNNPSNNPTNNPTNNPSNNPTNNPTNNPSNNPTNNPTNVPTNEPTKQPTKQPTHNPTNNPSNNPTNNPTAVPTHVPTSDCFDSKCENSPCSCTEVENCKTGTCHAGSGCNQCVNGYFKIDYDYHCIPCSVTGVGCKFCTDFLGCQQCKKGYSRVFDEECGIYVCV